MGLSIGPASSALAPLNASGINRPPRSDAPRASEGDEARLVQESEAPPVQVGFGENSLSPSGAALETLDSNLAVARELVPTVAELRERARVVQAERRAAAPTPRPVERPEGLRRRESVRPEPDAAVQNFVDDAGTTERPVETQEAPPLEPQDATRPTPAPSPVTDSRIDFRV